MAELALDHALRFWDPVLHYALGSEHRNACLNEMIAVCPDLRRLLDDVRQFCAPREQGLAQGYGVQLHHLSYAATATSQDVVYRFVQFLSRYVTFAACAVRGGSLIIVCLGRNAFSGLASLAHAATVVEAQLANRYAGARR